MPIRDEKTFTDDEFIAAFAILLPPDQAREEGLAWNSAPDIVGFENATPAEWRKTKVEFGPRSYDGDILDLLSLVSDSCAARAWRLLGLTSEEGERRREIFRAKVREAKRQSDEE